MLAVQPESDATVLGRGVYSYREAAWLLGVSTRKVRDWFEGRTDRPGGVFSPEYRGITSQSVISFLDVIDASVAVALRKKGTPMQTVRKFAAALAGIMQTEHPFSRQELFADKSGRRIFIKAATEAGDEVFLEVIEKQHAMPQVFLPILKRIDYDPKTRLAQRLRLTDSVLIDPRRRYGKPIVEASGMPTSILARAYRAQGRDAEAVADWYGVSPRDVEDAVAFEHEFSGIAA